MYIILWSFQIADDIGSRDISRNRKTGIMRANLQFLF